MSDFRIWPARLSVLASADLQFVRTRERGGSGRGGAGWSAVLQDLHPADLYPQTGSSALHQSPWPLAVVGSCRCLACRTA